jgi:hypothetical protein
LLKATGIRGKSLNKAEYKVFYQIPDAKNHSIKSAILFLIFRHLMSVVVGA